MPRIDPARVLSLVAFRLSGLEAASGGHVVPYLDGDVREGSDAADDTGAGGAGVGAPAGTANRPWAVLVGVGVTPVGNAPGVSVGGASGSAAIANITVRVRVASPVENSRIAPLSAWYSAAGHVGKRLERVALAENTGGGPGEQGHVVELYTPTYPDRVVEDGDDSGLLLVGEITVPGRVMRDAWVGNGGGDGQVTYG